MGFNKSLFEDQLKNLNRGTKSITTLSHWLSFYSAEAQTITECWLKAVESFSEDDTKLVCLLYVAHEVLMLTRKMPLTFASEFGKILPKMLPPLCAQYEHPEFLRIISTLTKIWKDSHIFSNETCLTLEKLVAAYPPYGIFLSTTTYFPELIQISKQIEESNKFREILHNTTKRRKSDTTDALISAEITALETAAESLRAARKLVSDVSENMTENIKKIDSDIRVFKEHDTKVKELLVRNASSAAKTDDITLDSSDQPGSTRFFEKGDIVVCYYCYFIFFSFFLYLRAHCFG